MQNRKAAYNVETLEQRILLSADPIGSVFHSLENESVNVETHVLVEQEVAGQNELGSGSSIGEEGLWSAAAIVEARSDDASESTISEQFEEAVDGASIAIGGTTEGTDYSTLTFEETIALSGRLTIELTNGFVPTEGDTFTLISAPTINGAFTDASGLFGFAGGLYFFLEQDGDSVDLTVKSLSLAADLAFISDLLAVNDQIGLVLNTNYFGSPVGPISIDAQINAGPVSIGGTFSVNLNAGDLVVTGEDANFELAIGDKGLSSTDLAFGLRLSRGAGYALAADGSVSLDGFEGVSASGAFAVEINRSDTSSVDFGSYGTVDFGSTDAVTRVGGDSLEIIVDGVAKLSGGFSIERSTSDSGSEMSVSGSGITVEADLNGANTPELSLSGANLDLVLLEDGTYALRTTDATITANGLGPVGLQGTLNLAINTTGSAEVDFGDAEPFDFGTEIDTFAFSGDDIEITVAEFFAVSGSIAFRPIELEGTLSGDAGTRDLAGYIFGATNLSGFAGLNGGSPDAIGLSLDGIEFALAYLTDVDGTDSWFSLQGSAGSAVFSGYDILELSATDVSLSINYAAGSNSTDAVLSYAEGATELTIATGAESEIALDMDGDLGALTGLSGTFELLFSDYFRTSGSLAFSKSLANITLSDGNTADVQVLAIGGTDLAAFAGINASRADRVGFELEGVAFALALSEETDVVARNWISLQATATGVKLIGIDGITVGGSDLLVEVNLEADDGTVVDYSDESLSLSISQSTTDSFTLSIDGSEGELYRTGGNLELDLSGFFRVAGSFALESLTDTITLSDTNTVDVDVLAFGGSDLSAFVGTEGVGFGLSDVTFGLFAAIDQADPKRQWIGLEAEVGSAALSGLEGVTAEVSNLSVQTNLPAYDDTLIDFEASPVDVPVDSVGSVLSIALAAAEGRLLRVLADLELDFYGFFQIAGSFAVQKNRSYLTLSDGESVEVDVLAFGGTNLSAFAGANIDDPVNRIGFQLTNASFAANLATEVEGDGVFTSIEAAVDSASLQGASEVVVSGTDLLLQINRSTDARYADFKSAEYSIPVGPGEDYVFTMDGDAGELTAISGSMDIILAGFVSASGNFAVRKSLGSVSLFESDTATDVEILTIGASAVSVFAGIGAGGDEAVGLNVELESLAIAIISQSDNPELSYTSLVAEGGGAQLVGLSSITVALESTVIEVNLPAEDGSLVDYGSSPLEIATGPDTVTSISLDGSMGQTLRFGGEMDLEISGFLQLSGAFFFNSSLDSVSVTNGETPEADVAVRKLTLGAEGVNGFAGVAGGTDSAIGFELSNLSIAIALLSEDEVDGREWISAKGSLDSTGLSGVDSVEFALTDVILSLNLAASDGTVVDYDGSALAIDVSPSSTIDLDHEGDRGELLEISGSAFLRVSEFFAVSGSLAVTSDTGSATLSDGTTVAVERLLVGGSSLAAFAGTGANTSQALGFNLSETEFALAIQRAEDGITYTTLEATAGSVSLIGVESVEIVGANLAVNINTADSGEVVVDYSEGATVLSVPTGSGSTYSLSLAGDEGVQVNASGALSVSVASFVIIEGDFAIESKTTLVRVAGANVNKEVNLLSIGATGVSAFIGNNANTDQEVGFALENLSFGLGLFSDTASTENWVALSGYADSVSVKGVPDLTLATSGLALEVNLASGSGTVLDFAKQGVSLNTGPESAIDLAFDGEQGALLRASGSFDLGFAGFVSLSGTLGIEMTSTSVRVTDTEDDIVVDLLSVSATSVSAFVGTGGGTADALGLSISDLGFSLGIFTEAAPGARSWVAMQGSVGSVSVEGLSDVLTLESSSLSLQINQAASDDSVLDFATTVVGIEISEELTASFDFDGTEGEILKVSGQVSVAVADFFSVAGDFSIENLSGSVRVAGEDVDTDVSLLTIGGSGVRAFAGLNAGTDDEVGLLLEETDFAVVVASDSSSSRVWTTVSAAARSVSFEGLGDGLALSGSDLGVAVNISATDGSVLDYSTTGISVPSGADSSIDIDLDGNLGEILQVNGTLNVRLFDYLNVGGSFSFEKSVQSIQLVGESDPITVDSLTFGGVGLSLFAGLNADTPDAIGLQLEDVSFAVALLSDSAGSGETWLAAQGAAGSFGIVGISGLTLNSSELELKGNIAGDQGSLIDFASAPLTVEVFGEEIVFDIDGGLGETVSVSGSLDMEVLGIGLAGDFAFIKTKTTVGRDVIALAVENVSIGSFSGDGTEGATISIVDARGLLAVTEDGVAGSLSFNASVAFGPFDAGASIFLRINTTGRNVYFDSPFGSIGLLGGVYTKLDFADLTISIPGVEIEGSFSVLSDTDDGGQLIAGDSINVFVGGNGTSSRVGMSLQKGSGLLYKRGDNTAGTITGIVEIYGVPGLDFKAEMTLTVNNFREGFDLEGDVNGEVVTLVLDDSQIANAAGDAYIQFSASEIDITLLNTFGLSGDITVTRGNESLLIGTTSMSLFAGDTESGIGLELGDIEMAAFIPTDGQGFALSILGTPALVGVEGIEFGDSLRLGFQYNSTGESVEESVPTIDGSVDLLLSAGLTSPLFFGSADISLGGFITLRGAFAISYASGDNEHLMIGFADVEIFTGAGSGADRIGLLAEVSSLGVYVDLTESGGFALAGTGALGLVGLDGLSIGGTADLRINTTGKAVSGSISIPGLLNGPVPQVDGRTPLNGNTGIAVDFATGDTVVEFGAALSLSVPGLLDVSGTASISRSPSGRVDIALTEASLQVSAFDNELFSLSGEAFFSIDPVTGFSLDDFYLNGFSILGLVGGEIPSTSTSFAPTAEVVSPAVGASISISDLRESAAIDVFFSVRGSDTIDESTILDDGAEFILLAGNVELPLSGIPEAIGINTYRYAIDSDELAALEHSGFEEWKVTTIAGSFATESGELNSEEDQVFYVTDGSGGTTASLEGSAGSGTVDMVLINGAAYLDVRFTDHTGSGLDSATILDPDPEFTLSGSGVLDAGAEGALSGIPMDLGDGLYRYQLTDLTPDDDSGLFGPGEVTISFVASSWSAVDGTEGLEGSVSFSVEEDTAATAEPAEPITLGPLSLLEPSIGIEELGFVDGQLSVTLALSAESIDLGFGDGAVTTKVEKITGTFDLLIDALGFLEGAGSITPSGKWNLTVGEINLAVDGIVEARAVGVEVNYDPNYDPTNDPDNDRSELTGQTLVVVDEIAVTIPVIGLTGSVTPYDPDGSGPEQEIPGLVVWENGFRLGTATLTYGVSDTGTDTNASAASSSSGEPAISIGGIIEFDDIRVGITNFEVISGQEFSFNGDIFIASGGASFFPGSAVNASFRDRTSGTALSGKSEAEDTEAVRAVLQFTDGSPSGFVFYADTFQISFGSVVQVFATDVYINTSAGANEEVVSFSSIGASLNVGPLAIKGEARNFAFLGDGTFVTKQGFGVFFGGSEDGSSALGLPSWLPLYIDFIGVEWPDINANPADFVLTLSGGVKEIEGIPGAKFSGSVEGLKIDVGLLLEGKFPIVDLGAFTIGIEANVFGGSLSGTIVAGLLKIGTDGEMIPVSAPSDTEVVDRVMFLGIQGGFDMSGLALSIRFAVSELGPLGVLVGLSIPGGILLDVSGTTGISMNDFTGGVEFYKSLPDLTDAKQLRDPSLRLSTTPDPDKWLDTIKEQVVLQWQTVQANPGLGGFFGAFTQPMIISGSAKIFTAYASEQAFNGQVEVQISTDGKILLIGTLNFLDDSLSISAALYANLSKILEGTGTFLFLTTVPDQVDILEIGGEFSFGFTGPGGEPVTLPAFVVTDEGIQPIESAPQAELAAPVRDASIDVVRIRELPVIGVTFLPGTGAELDVDSLNDGDIVFTITGPGGSWDVSGPGTLDGLSYYYALPAEMPLVPGQYTVDFAAGSFQDTEGRNNEATSTSFTITAVFATIVNLQAGSRISLSDAKELGSIDFYVGPTRGSSFDESSLLDASAEWTVESPNGTRYPLTSKPVSLGGGQYGVSLPIDLEWIPGEWTFELSAGELSDTGGFTNAATVYSVLVEGAEAQVNLNPDGVSISTLNGKGYIDVQYTGAAGSPIEVDSVLDAIPEFTLGGAAADSISILNDQVSAVGNGIYRYPFTGEFSTGEFNITVESGSFVDVNGVSNFAKELTYNAVELGGTLVEPRAFDVAERNQINSRQYILVAFDDPLGVGMNAATIMDNGLEFRLSGDGVGTAVLSGAATPVDVDGETLWKYPFSGSFEEGVVTVDFLDGNWADNSGNLGSGSQELISVYRQSSSFYISLGGFVELEAGGLTPDYDGNGEPDPLLLLKGEVRLTFEEVVDEVTFETTGLLMNLQVSATLELFYLGNIGSAAANLTVGFGDVDAGGGLFGENTIAIWGAIKIQSNLGFLENIGIKANAEMMLYVNSTNTDRNEVLVLEGIQGDVVFTFNDAGIVASLPATAAPGDYQDAISDELRALMESEGFFLTDSLTVQGVVNGSKWRIIDNGDNQKTYFLDRDDTGEVSVATEAQNIDLPGLTFAIEASGELIIGDLLSMTGEFYFGINAEMIELRAQAVMNTILGDFAVSGEVRIIYDQGLVGSLQLGLSSNAFGNEFFYFSGTFQLELNTTAIVQEITVLDVRDDGTVAGLKQGTIDPFTLRIAIAGRLSIAGFVEFTGSAGVSFSPNGFEAYLNMNVNLGIFGNLKVIGNARIATEDGETYFAMRIRADFNFGIGEDFGVYGDVYVAVNTSTKSAHFGVAASSFAFLIDAQVKVVVLNANVTGSITYAGGVFAMSFSGSLNFFDFLSIGVSGYVDSNGNFSVTGSASWSLEILIIRIAASFELSFSNSGFSFLIDGSVDVKNPLFFLFDPEWIEIASLRGQVAITTTSALISVTASLLGIISIDVDIFWTWGGNVGTRDIMKVEDTLDLGGRNRTLPMNDIEIFSGGRIQNPGGKITFSPNSGTSVINIGNGTGSGVTVDKTELSRIDDGTAGLVFGNTGKSYRVNIGNPSNPGDILTAKDPIIVNNTGGSGDTYIASEMRGNSDAYLQVNGSGNTTYIYSDISMGSDILIYDSIVLDASSIGDNVIDLTAGTGGVGNIVLGTGSSRLDGNGDSVPDYLNLSALGGGDITINSEIGQTHAPHGLTINGDARDVTFTGDVTVDGDLIIHATGDIVFSGDLTLLNGGSLIISGANSVSFNESQSVISLTGVDGSGPGNALIVADNMQLPASSSAATANSGTLTLLPRDVGRQIEAGSPVVSGATPALQLSVAELQLLGSGWSMITIGYEDTDGYALAGTGPVFLGGATRSEFTLLSPTKVFGSTITVVDYTDNDRVLRINSPLSLIALGDITIDNELEVGEGLPENLVVLAEAGTILQNESVSAITGEVLYEALNNVYQNANIYANGSLITVVATTGEIVMADGTVTYAEGALVLIAPGPFSVRQPTLDPFATAVITYTAGTDVYISILQANLKIEITAATAGDVGGIYDNLTLDVAGVDNNITSSTVIMSADTGIGEYDDAINTAADTLELLNAISGGIFIQETDSVEILSAVATLAVPSSNGRDGAIIIDSLEGLMTVTGAVSAHGHVRLHVTMGSILANASIQSVDKDISILALRDITITDGIDVTTSSTGTIDLEALIGSITLSTTSDLITGSGDVRLLAGINITLGGYISTTGSVSATAVTGWIRDGDTDAGMDIFSFGLRLWSAIGVGQLGASVNPVETTSSVLSARVGTEGLNILETDQLLIGDTRVVVDRVNSDASSTDVIDDTQSDLTSTNSGSIVVRTLNGDLTFLDGSAPVDDISVHANGSGRILLEAIGAGTSITFHADIISDTGEISMLADLNVTSTGTADILSGASGTIDVEARNGSITYSVNSDQRTGFGDIRFNAEINITLGGVTETLGDVSGTAVTGWIRDGDNDGTVDIISNELRFWAFIGVGQLGAQVNPIETTVTTMSSRAGVEGINILETDDLIVDASDVTIQRVLPDQSIVPVTDEARVDVTTYQHGSIVVRTINGDMYLVGGADATVRAFGPPGADGNVLLETIGKGTSIEVFKNIVSDRGNITLLAAWDIISHLTASIQTDLSGTIELEATKGSINLSQGTDIESFHGDIKLYADNNVLLGGEVTTLRNVWIMANSGSVFDQVRDGTTDVISDKLVVLAGSGIGQKRNDFEFTVNDLTIHANEDDMYLMGNKTLTLLDGISNEINRVTLDASIQFISNVSEGAGLESGDTTLLELRKGDLIIVREIYSPLGLRLVLQEGSVVDARGSAGPDITADWIELRATEFGGSLNPVEIEVTSFSAALSGDLNTTNVGDLILGNAGELSGFTSTNGDIEIITTGSIEVEGMRTGGLIQLTATTGYIWGGLDTEVLDLEGQTVELISEIGLGTTGSGALDIAADHLVLVNGSTASAYLNVFGSTTIGGLDLAGPGSLFLRVTDGNLTMSGINSVYGGDAVIQVRGDFSITGNLLVSGQLRLTAESISGRGASVESSNGNIYLRSVGAIDFDAFSTVVAGIGTINTLSGTNTIVGLIHAGVRADILSRLALSSASVVSSPIVRMFSAVDSLSVKQVMADVFYPFSTVSTEIGALDGFSDDEQLFRVTRTAP
jgi:hypothetical protein